MSKMSEVKKYVKEHKKGIAIGAAVVTGVAAGYYLIKNKDKAFSVASSVYGELKGRDNIHVIAQNLDSNDNWMLVFDNTSDGNSADLVAIGKQIMEGLYNEIA